jgi:hypothetical protein
MEHPTPTPKTKQVKTFTLTAGDKLLLKFDTEHSAVREITEIHRIKGSSLYTITCELGVSITCDAQKKQAKVIE